MMKLKIGLLVMLWILLSVPSRAQNYTPAQVRQQINAVASRMKTMTCDFVQTKSVAMLKSKLVSRGYMYYAQPNKSVVGVYHALFLYIPAQWTDGVDEE